MGGSLFWMIGPIKWDLGQSLKIDVDRWVQGKYTSVMDPMGSIVARSFPLQQKTYVFFRLKLSFDMGPICPYFFRRLRLTSSCKSAALQAWESWPVKGDERSWRIIPGLVRTVRITSIYKPFLTPWMEGVPQPQVSGTKPITMVINHVSKSWDDPPSRFHPNHFFKERPIDPSDPRCLLVFFWPLLTNLQKKVVFFSPFPATKTVKRFFIHFFWTKTRFVKVDLLEGPTVEASKQPAEFYSPKGWGNRICSSEIQKTPRTEQTPQPRQRGFVWS